MTRTIVFCSPESVLHTTFPGHPESAARYQKIVSALTEKSGAPLEKVIRVQEKWLFLCHDRQYVRSVKRECSQLGEHDIAMLSTGDTQISRGSYRAAVAAVGAALEAVEGVMKGRCQNGFVVVRPPGHHAARSVGMGFCLFNTVAIAARYIQRQHGLRRIAIIDWDVHHGNGTESLLGNDLSILYWSTHEQGSYPRTGNESHGTCYHYPIQPGVQSRNHLIRLYQEDLQSVLTFFKPEFILISCGFDAHKDDPLGHLALESEDFFTLTQAVRRVADTVCHGRLVSILEGGYSLEAIAQSSLAHVSALNSGVST